MTRVSPAQQMAHMMHIKQEQMGEQEMDNFQDMFNAPNVSSEVRPAHETVSRLCEQPLSSPWASPYRGAERSQEGPEAPDGRKTAPLNSSVSFVLVLAGVLEPALPESGALHQARRGPSLPRPLPPSPGSSQFLSTSPRVASGLCGAQNWVVTAQWACKVYTARG